MPLKVLTPITAGNRYCVRATVEPARRSGKDGSSYVMNGTFFDTSAPFDFSKWSGSLDDFKGIVDGGCYILSKPVLERVSADEALWPTSPSKTKIKITKSTILTREESPPSTLPQHPIQPTLKLSDLRQRLNDKSVSGHKMVVINGADVTQARFLLVDLHGTITNAETIKTQADGFCYDCTLADGDSKQAKIYGVDCSEAGAARFALVKGKAYIIIVSCAEKAEAVPTLTLQRGLLIKQEDLGVVTKNFSSAAQHTREIFALQGSDTAAPTSFAELVKCGATAGVKRKYVDKFATPEKEHDDALSPFISHGTVQPKRSKMN